MFKSDWSQDQKLYVAASYSNPFRWKTRRDLTNNFRHHMESSPNVVLYVGELAYGDRPFECTDSNYPLDIQLRTQFELFHKENILNRVIQMFPPDWKYGAWVDSDFHITRHDWALEAIHQLQHYDFVQLFSSYVDLSGQMYGSAHLPVRMNSGFALNYITNGYKLPPGYENGGWKKKKVDLGYYGAMIAGKRAGVGATGGGWAFRRSAFETVGGLLDQCILGHGDWFMTFGLVMEEAPDMHIDGYSLDYRRVLSEWQINAAKLKKNIGYIDAFAIHHFHGSKIKRGYANRDTILVKHQFSPLRDLKRDWQGIYQLNSDRSGLRDAIRAYFISRNEDDPNLYGSEKVIV